MALGLFIYWWNTHRFKTGIVRGNNGRYYPSIDIRGHSYVIVSLASYIRSTAERNLADYLSERIIKAKDFDGRI